MLNHWVTIQRVVDDGDTMFVGKCDIFPDVRGFGDTAEEAYDAVCKAIDGLLPDLAQKAKSSEPSP